MNGKLVSFMEKYIVGEKEVNLARFEETSPDEFRNTIAALDLQ